MMFRFVIVVLVGVFCCNFVVCLFIEVDCWFNCFLRGL